MTNYFGIFQNELRLNKHALPWNVLHNTCFSYAEFCNHNKICGIKLLIKR